VKGRDGSLKGGSKRPWPISQAFANVGEGIRGKEKHMTERELQDLLKASLTALLSVRL
jgi:hypothetical protein